MVPKPEIGAVDWGVTLNDHLDTLDANVATKASAATVDALTTEVATKASTASVDSLTAEVATKQAAASLAADVAAIDGNAASALRVQQDARLTATYARGVTLQGAGIDPTGTSDSAAAIQSKLNGAAAFGAPVLGVTGATYRLNSEVTLPNGLRLDGRGSTFVASPGAAHHLLRGNNASSVTIQGVTIDLNRGAVTAPASAFGTDAIGIYLAGGYTNVVIRDVTVKNGHQNGIRANKVATPGSLTLDNVTITDCMIGAFIDNASKLSVQGGEYSLNRQDGLYVDEGSGHRISAVTANDNARHGVVIDTAATGFAITGCTASGNGTGSGEGIGICVSVDCSRFTVAGNTCRNNKTAGIQIDTNNGTSTQVDAYGTVTGNTCTGSTEFHGIYVTYARYVAVTGNVCAGNAHSGIAISATNATVTGNVLAGNTNSGLQLGYGAGTTPNMGDHTVGPNTYVGNGTPVTIWGAGAETPSRFVDPTRWVDVADGAALRLGSSSTTQAVLERSGTKRVRFNDTSALFDAGRLIEFSGTSGNTATLSMPATTLVQRGGANGFRWVNNTGSTELMTLGNTGALAHNGTAVGFNGSTPVAKAANPGTATGTDAAVINAVVSALRNLGLVT